MRFTSIVAVVGIAAGVASLIIAQAISKGFSDEIQDKVLRNTSHITIFNEGKTTVSDWRILEKQLKQIENVEEFEPTSYESAVVSSSEDSSYAVLRIKSEQQAVATDKTTERIQVSIGKELAKKLKVKENSQIDIVTLENEKMPKTTSVRIENVFETGLFEYDSTWIFVSESNYIQLKELDKFSPKVFSVSVNDIYKADQTAVEIRKRLGEDFKVLDWQEANKPLFAALSLERKVAFAIILLIVFIATLNVTTTLTLLVAERRLDIAVLRTCGAKTKNLVAIFLFEGIALSLCGIVFGVFIGLSVCFAGNYFKIIRLSKEVYSLNYIPFNTDFCSILTICLLAFLLSLLAIFYPSVKASRIKPLENLRMR